MKEFAGIKIPNKYDERVEDVELVNMYEDEWEKDGVHYMLYLTRPYITDRCSMTSVFGCVTKKEVLHIIRNAVKIDEAEWDKYCA